MRFISNGFYFLIAIIAILWSFASSFEKDGSSRPKSDSFSNKNITSIKTIEYSNNMNTPTSNKKNLRSLPKFTIQSESKIRRQGGSGTAFYVGQDTWVTARHVINQCPKVMMSFGKKHMIIKDHQEIGFRRFAFPICLRSTVDEAIYPHIEIVVALLVVKIINCLIIASFGAGVMTWVFGEMFSYVSSTLLYLLEAKNQATDPSFLLPKFLEK